MTDIQITADSGTTFEYKGVKDTDPRRWCTCGCNQQVVKKAIYRPGHDARHISQLVAAVVEHVEKAGRKRALVAVVREAFAEVPTPALTAKLGTRLVKALGEAHAELVIMTTTEALARFEDEEGEGE